MDKWQATFLGLKRFPRELSGFETEAFNYLRGYLWGGRRTKFKESFEHVPLQTYLQRNFGVYGFGLGTGFPLVSLFTLNSSYNRAKKGEIMSWDQSTGTRSFAISPNRSRIWIVGILYIGLLLLLNTWGTAYRNTAQVESVDHAQAPPATNVANGASESVNPIPSSHPKIYTYLDADGIRHYTDVPDNNRYKLLVFSSQDLTESGQHYDPALLARAIQYDTIVEKAAASASVDPNLLRAVIVVGSGFNSRAVSKRGAVGLMQLMPATATRFGVSNPYDPKQNVHAGAHYLKFLIDRFGQDIRLALAAYNAGEEAVDRNGGQIPPFTETMAYVSRVLKIYRMLTEQKDVYRNPSKVTISGE